MVICVLEGPLWTYLWPKMLLAMTHPKFQFAAIMVPLCLGHKFNRRHADVWPQNVFFVQDTHALYSLNSTFTKVQYQIVRGSHFWTLAHSSVQSSSSSAIILRDVSSSLRVHKSSASSGVRYPFTTSLGRMIFYTHNRQQNTHIAVARPKPKNDGFWKNHLTQWTTRRESLTEKRRPSRDRDSATG